MPARIILRTDVGLLSVTRGELMDRLDIVVSSISESVSQLLIAIKYEGGEPRITLR